ncbi:MAG: methyltransferase domain-containing protein [Desulfatirhabdiaceae bacterium]
MISESGFLLCPNCKKSGGIPLQINSAGESLICKSCGYCITKYEGIPDFADYIEIDSDKFSTSQKIMNTHFFSRLYETPFWRPLHTFIGSGMSWKAENHIIMDMLRNGNPSIIADVACGTGHYARALMKQFPDAQVYALDISLSMLMNGQKKALQSSLQSIKFLRGDLYQLPFDDSTLDIVNCSGALHLFPNISPIFDEISRVLKPGGIFTAMTLAPCKGIVGVVQHNLMKNRKAVFFDPDILSQDL